MNSQQLNLQSNKNKKYSINFTVKKLTAIILAAGLGKRMKSTIPKVLHKIGDKTLIEHSLQNITLLNPSQIITVVSPLNQTAIKKVLGNKTSYAIQINPLGTADAAKSAIKYLDRESKTVAILNGDDTAFYKKNTLEAAFNQHQKSNAVITLITLDLADPIGFGRIVRTHGKISRIVEEKDATEDERKIREVNDGVYFIEKVWLIQNIHKIKPSIVTKEIYLTDLVKFALKVKEKVETFKLKDPGEWHGINTPGELEEAKGKIMPRIHIMGASGAGASAVAGIAQNFGYPVTGCDLNPKSAYTEKLSIKIFKGHRPSHLEGVDLLITSPAVQKLNPKNKEFKKAKSLKIPIISWQEFQGKFLQKGKYVIAVAGAYGKSTTTAMISQVLIDAGLDPTCEVGAKVLAWKTNFRAGKSKYYVCEADEYNNNFLSYRPNIAVVLNVAWDHPDFFKKPQSLLSSYQKFISNVENHGYLVIGDDPKITKIVNFLPKRAKKIQIAKTPKLQLSIIGDFRKGNAQAALTIAEILGLNRHKAIKSLKKFNGIARRLEYKGTINRTQFWDDYAVQPFTVKTTTNALKEKFAKEKLLLVLEPHTFSRINIFFDDFVVGLKSINVDEIFITEVYAARETGNTSILSKKLAKAVGPRAKFTGNVESTAKFVHKNLAKYNTVLSMGAGDIYKLYDLVLSEKN